jgi:uncharacterized protein (TIGR02597 family)
MKRPIFSISFSIAAFILTPISILGQTSGTSSPVGFVTVTLPGTGGATATRLSFDALAVTQPVSWQGTATTVGTNTVTDSSATWTDSQFNGTNGAYYLEILSVNGSTTASGVGTNYTITATTASSKTLTLETSLASGITAPVVYGIRPFWTIGSVFGTSNSVGLQGGTATSADQVVLWNGTGYDTYYYQTSGLGGTGWRKTGAASVDASGTAIFPDECFLVKRGQSSDVSFVLTGALKTGQTSVPIAYGMNFVGNIYGAAMTLASSGLYTGSSSTGLAGGTATSADQVLLWNGTGYDTYYYQTSGLGGTGWRKTGAASSDASATSIASGVGFIVRRLNTASFSWVVPQSPTSL